MSSVPPAPASGSTVTVRSLTGIALVDASGAIARQRPSMRRRRSPSVRARAHLDERIIGQSEGDRVGLGPRELTTRTTRLAGLIATALTGTIYAPSISATRSSTRAVISGRKSS